ncbi:MAG: hypothetical protein LCH26_01180 [Proteobacteria bacterium]|nr:hypothetical protein [Pseudomonadota bacterium]
MLRIETFDHLKGGHSFFKAIGHPLVAMGAHALIQRLTACEHIALYDPQGWLEPFCEIHPLKDVPFSHIYVQRFEDMGLERLGYTTKPISQLDPATKVLFILSFEEDLFVSHLQTLLGKNVEVISLKELRLPQEMLTNQRAYLDPLNFATNFAFLREEKGLHTRLMTANYWSSYSGKPAHAWCHLLDERGQHLATWEESLGAAGSSFVIDSAVVRERFGLDDFCGQLFIHIVGAAGHDIVKYGLDIYSDDGTVLSCTHDANAWPADYYAGLPAPTQEEDVILWIQNSHPCPIPAGAVTLSPMGREEEARGVDKEVPPFGTLAVHVKDLFPELHWPAQLEIMAGKYFVRPRYEVVRKGLRRIAHANVERTNLAPDPKIKTLAPLFGKGFILPAPLLPWDTWESHVLPTPMARSQKHLPVALLIYGADGHEMGEYRFGNLPRHHRSALMVNDLLKEVPDEAGKGYGHMELVYDFEAGDEADGWLHALFRYENAHHQTETSFGSHIYNTAMTYKTQPHSYRGAPPGLTTRLFLPTGPQGTQAFCHLIYPASATWHGLSQTSLMLHNAQGECVATEELRIPCGGSRLWRVSDIFSQKDIEKAGERSYIIIRDTTCRLFGYHGLQDAQGRLGMDHMFGF